MTKKHFIAFARHLNIDLSSDQFSPEYEQTIAKCQYAASVFAAVAMTDNPRFDVNRFMVACGLREGK